MSQGTGGPLVLGAVLERRYRIESTIARGGMSTVFKGTDLRLDRPIAIKVMEPKYAADPSFLARFEFEARAVAKLRHPGLVAVFDQGVDRDHVFLVMELVDGGTLRDLLRQRGPMPPHAATAVMSPMLGALGEAHDAHLVHRDVKPENVLISERGEVKIADFGLVRAVAAAAVTSASVILGTAAYLSPEQVTSGSADPRSDVYACGILLFELLTGRTPFTGDTPISVAYQRIDQDVPPPSSLIAGVPPQFDELVRIATSRDPAGRFANANAMREYLGHVAAELRLPAFRVPAPRKAAPSAPPRSIASAPPRPLPNRPVVQAGAPAIPAPVLAPPVSSAPFVPSAPSAPSALPVPAAPFVPSGPAETRVDHRPEPHRDTRPEHAPSDQPFSRVTPIDPVAQRRSSRRVTALWLLLVVIAAGLLALVGWLAGSIANISAASPSPVAAHVVSAPPGT